jgi:hypothetical protein
MKNRLEQAAPNKSPKPTLESVVVLRGFVRGSAAWLKRYISREVR